MSRSDAETPPTVSYVGATGHRRRIRFEPRRFDIGYWRIIEERLGSTWRPVLREPVRDLTPDEHRSSESVDRGDDT